MSNGRSPKPRRGFAIASLVLGILSLPTVGLLGVGAMAGVVLGVVGLVKARNAPTEYGGRGLAVAGIALSALSVLVMPFVLGIVAAIAIPSFLRARVSANESAAIGDVRTVMAAEAEYRSVNGGHYDTLECLASPSRCIPGHAGPPMLPAPLGAPGLKQGYRRVFHAGPAAAAPPATVSPSSMTSFAYVAIPEQAGRTGIRAFCGDASGRVCYEADGSMPETLPGECPAGCASLR